MWWNVVHCDITLPFRGNCEVFIIQSADMETDIGMLLKALW
jgi:hypothetical protein